MLITRVRSIVCEMLQHLLVSTHQARTDRWMMIPTVFKLWQEPTFLAKACIWSKWLWLRTWHILEGNKVRLRARKSYTLLTVFSIQLCTCRKSYHWHHRQDLYSNSDIRNCPKGRVSDNNVGSWIIHMYTFTYYSLKVPLDLTYSKSIEPYKMQHAKAWLSLMSLERWGSFIQWCGLWVFISEARAPI